LVEAGLLELVEGRGRGSGVRLTPHSMSVFLISWLGTDSLSEVVERTRVISAAVHKNGQCHITGKRTFINALAAVLSSKDLLKSKRVRRVTISRTTSEASLSGKLGSISRFIGVPGRPSGTQLEAWLDSETIRAIMKDVIAIIEGREVPSVTTLRRSLRRSDRGELKS